MNSLFKNNVSNSEIILKLQKSCKKLFRKVPYTLHPAPLNVSILHNHGRITATREQTAAPQPHAGFGWRGYLLSKLWQCLSLPSLSRFWRVLASSLKMPLNLSLLDVFSWLEWGYMFLSRISQKQCCAFLSVSYQEERDVGMSRCG